MFACVVCHNHTVNLYRQGTESPTRGLEGAFMLVRWYSNGVIQVQFSNGKIGKNTYGIKRKLGVGDYCQLTANPLVEMLVLVASLPWGRW